MATANAMSLTQFSASAATGPPDRAELLLHEYVRALIDHRHGRQVVHVRLSALQAYNRRQQHLRAATSGFEALVNARLGQLFVLASTDLLFFYETDLANRVHEEVEKIFFLFGDDPLLREPYGRDAFITVVDCDAGYDDVISRVRRLAAEAAPRRVADETRQASETRYRLRRRQHHGEELSPEMLERIEATLHHADVSNLIRRQMVCAVTPQLTVKPRFAELFISIHDLSDAVLPGADLVAHPWLFRRLTESLDHRMLAHLSLSENTKLEQETSVNLNLATLSSREFQAFDAALTTMQIGHLLIEIQASDVFADLDAFLFTRDLLQGKGYRVCLDGLSCRHLALIDWSALGADVVKAIWDPRLADDAAGIDDLRRHLHEVEADRVVLTRVDCEQGVRLGQDVGISVFQGRFIDLLVRDDHRRRQLARLKRLNGHDT